MLVSHSTSYSLGAKANSKLLKKIDFLSYKYS